MAGVPRNQLMVERIEAAPVNGVVRFALAGDSGAWWDPTADAIYSALVDQIARLRPAPAFFVNLGVRVIQAFDRAGATTRAF